MERPLAAVAAAVAAAVVVFSASFGLGRVVGPVGGEQVHRGVDHSEGSGHGDH